jgi:hypothetical protein
MADNAPRKTGLYERPSGKGLMIGIVVLVVLIVLAIVFFSNRRAGATALGASGKSTVTAPSRGERPGGLVRAEPPAYAP